MTHCSVEVEGKKEKKNTVSFKPLSLMRKRFFFENENERFGSISKYSEEAESFEAIPKKKYKYFVASFLILNNDCFGVEIWECFGSSKDTYSVSPIIHHENLVKQTQKQGS